MRLDTGIIHFLSAPLPDSMFFSLCICGDYMNSSLKRNMKRAVNLKTAIQMFEAKPGRFIPVSKHHYVKVHSLNESGNVSQFLFWKIEGI
jgi:hypothetical protein